MSAYIVLAYTAVRRRATRACKDFYETDTVSFVIIIRCNIIVYHAQFAIIYKTYIGLGSASLERPWLTYILDRPAHQVSF